MFQVPTFSSLSTLFQFERIVLLVKQNIFSTLFAFGKDFLCASFTITQYPRTYVI